MTTAAGAARVAVCAISYRRPEALTRLLDGLGRLEVDDSAISPTIVIVDNDEGASAGPVVHGARLPWPIVYAIEPERGIPFARNRAVREAAGADFLAFIDDDEIPDPRWLTELVAAQRRTDADVVTGPVVPEFEEPPERWITDGGFFERPRFRTDEVIPWATTSSVLIRMALLDRYPSPFNERMRHTGGTDTHLFMRAHNDGAKIVWTDEAIVTERFPASRVNTRWLLRREYRRGNTMSLSHCDLEPTLYRKVRQFASGGYKIARGIALTITGAFRGRAGTIKGLQVVWLGAGVIAGVVGVRYEEYKQVHGR